jgi:hypothetical protein
MPGLRQGDLFKVAMLCKLRSSLVPEGEIASKLGFGSAEAMHVQLKNWGLPGLLRERTIEPERGRRARTAREEAVELPSAYDAAALFHEALRKLGWAIGNLENRREYLQDERFLAQEDAGSGDWPEMGVEGGKFILPLGASQAPLEPLPALIAVYLLADEPLEPLLEALNRHPEAVNKGQVLSLIEGEKTAKGHKRGLKSIAGMIARSIRGGKIKPGPDTGEFTERIQNGVWYSRQLSERNLAPGTISARLKEAGFTGDEIDQIRSLGRVPKPH